MQICDGRNGGRKGFHEDIVYHEIDCPLCEVLDKVADLEAENTGLKEMIRALEGKVEELEAELEKR